MSQPGVTCSTCPAWDTEDGQGGECHGDVPVAFLLPAPPNPLNPTEKRGIDVKRVFRPTLPVDWCARHPKFDWDIDNKVRSMPTMPVGGRA